MEKIKIVCNPKKNGLNASDYTEIVKSVFGKDSHFEIEDDNRKFHSSLTLEYKRQTHFVFLSSISTEARNVFISQPLLNVKKFVPKIVEKSTRIYVYVRACASATARTIFDIRCCKTFGMRFIGLDKLGDDVNISSIQRFQSLQEFMSDYTPLQDTSKGKGNNVTEIVETEDTLEISDAKTEGATYGSMLMLVFGLLNILPQDHSKRKKPLKIYLNKENKFGEDGLKYFSKLGVECAFAEDEIVALFRKDNRPAYDLDTNKRTPALQKMFTDELIRNVGHTNCQITGQTFGVISSHIFPCHIIEKLANSERIGKDLCRSLMTSKYNGLRLADWLDQLFDKGRIGYGEDGAIIVDEVVLDHLNDTYKDTTIEKIKSINLDDRTKTLMAFHRKYVYYKESLDEITNDEISLLESLFQ